MKASIAIPTVDRRRLLEQAVEGCLGQEFPPEEFEIIVVDNSAAGSQAWSAEIFGHRTDRNNRPIVRYVHEPRAGLAYARNRAIEVASGDYLLFLDDDEQPDDAHWLSGMLLVAQDTAADAVFGPVRPVYEEQPVRLKPFIEKLYTRCLEAADRADITQSYHYVGSGNSCFRMATCFPGGIRFDTRFNEIGGEDTELFRRLAKRGRHFHWAAGVGVKEFVPKSRIELGYLRARRFSKGQLRAFLQIAAPPKRVDWLLFWMMAGAMQAAYHGLAALAAKVAGREDSVATHAIQMQGGFGKVFWQQCFRPRRYGTSVSHTQPE